MVNRLGDTLLFSQPPVLAAWAAVGGKKESDGPLAAGFDRLHRDNTLDLETWEQAESTLQREAIDLCLQKAGLVPAQVQLALAGDLQNQCTASNYCMAGLDIPFAGLYGACSTMAERLCLACCLGAGGISSRTLCVTSSHFCAAERQFRTPLEYGGKRTPTAQWTATAAGAVLVQPGGRGVPVQGAAFGRVRDYQVTDINNMGAAMAPAAAQTILNFFRDTGADPQQFACVYTGDLGEVGSSLLGELLAAEGLSLKAHKDGGCLLYARQDSQVGAGASGAGCSAGLLCAHVLPWLADDPARRVLFLSTGALMSTTTFNEGQSIPGIAHLLWLGAAL